MMPDAEWEALKEKILREYPIRQRLAVKAGVKLNDQTLAELQALIETESAKG